jgi:hypothetical protein
MAMPEMEAVKDAALKYDKPTLARLAQSGQLSPTLAVMAGMMRDRVVQSEMKPPSPPTVAEEVMQPMGQRMGLAAAAQAPQQMPPQMPQQPQPQGQGLDQVPVPPQMFERQGMASGGIVAFQAGGGTPPPSFANMYSGLTPDLEALAEARRAYMGDFPTESEEERRNRRREEQALRLMEAGLGIAGGTSESFAANLKGALPAIRGYGTDLATQRKEDFLRLAAERGEKGKVFEGVLGARGKAAESAAAESRLDKELTAREAIESANRQSRETIEGANRKARITAANIAAGKPTDLRYYADNVVKAKAGDKKAQTIVEGIDNYLKQSALGRNIVAQQGVDVQAGRLNVELYDKAVQYTDSKIGRGGPRYNEYRQLQEKDKENAKKGNPTTLAEDLENSIRDRFIKKAQEQRQAQPGAAPAGAQGKPLPPPEAVSMLKDNPSALAKQQFDDAFGPGAAARALASK